MFEHKISPFFGVRILTFADEVVIYFSGTSVQEEIFKLESTTSRINTWLENLLLSIYLPKCSFVVFGKSPLPEGQFN